MKMIKTIGFAFAMLGLISFANAQSELKKEVNVEVINGERTVTIKTTDEKGNTTTETFKGDEAKEKMHELHSNVPEGAKIEREIIEEFTDDEGGTVIIRKSHSGDRGEMMRHHGDHPPRMSQEEREEFHARMKDLTKDLKEDEKKILHHHMRMLHHNLSPEEMEKFHEELMNGDIDVDVDLDNANNRITIKIGDDVEVIDLNEHQMMRIKHCEPGQQGGKGCCIPHGKCNKEMKGERVIIMKTVRIEDDNELQNDLKGIKFNAYPNPNNGEFNVELKLDGKTPTSFVISDTNGKVVHEGSIDVTEKGTHTLPIKMRGFESGVYLLQIVQGDKTATKKIIIE